jgi:small-conductance mechanosensitive channel
MIVTGGAYLVARAAMSMVRALFAPDAPAQRLIPCSDDTAGFITRWVRRFVVVAVVGLGTAEALLEFNLPWTVYDSIVRIVLLILSLFLVIIILQKREAVAAALRAPELPEGAPRPDASRRSLRAARNTAAEIWHILAILYLLALWAVWALQITDGFPRLLRASLATLMILVAAKLADLGLRRLLARLLAVSPEMARRYPGLPARSARYLPALQSLGSLLLGFVTVLFVLESWGAAAFAFFAGGGLGGRLLGALSTVALTVLAALVVWEAVNAAIQRQLERLSRDAQQARSARVRTLLPMLRTVLGLVLLVVVLFTLLTEIGVNVAPLLAGAGVLGLAIGFGSQTLVRDLITGIFLLMEDAVAVGDVVTLGGLSGTVEQLSIRAIKLRALDGAVHIIPFSAVSTVTNMTRDFSFAVVDISVGYGEDTDRVAEVLREIGREMRAEAKWNKPVRDEIEVMGVERFAESAVVIRARVKTEPAMRWAVGRELNRRIKMRFEEMGIEIPFPYRRVVVEGAEGQAAQRAAAAAAED